MYRYVSLISNVRVEIQMRRGHLFWVKNRQTSEVIDLQPLSDDYWCLKTREFTVLS